MMRMGFSAFLRRCNRFHACGAGVRVWRFGWGALVVAVLSGCGVAGGESGTPAAVLEQARSEIAYLAFEDAYPMYGQVLEAAEQGSDVWNEAMFGRAVCAQQIVPQTAALSAQAKQLFEALLEASPDSALAPHAVLHLARGEEMQDFTADVLDVAAAQRGYRRVLEQWPAHPAASEAALRLAGTHLKTYQPEQIQEGVAVLEGWLAAHPDDPMASGMWQYLSGSYQLLGQLDRAVEAMVKADEAGLLLDANPMNQYWFIAYTAHHDLNNRALAIRYYRKLIEDPATAVGGRAYEAQRGLITLGVVPPLMPGQEVLDPTLRVLVDEMRAENTGGPDA